MLLLIFNSAKPSFFQDENRANLFEVDPESGMLLNTDNGTPMPQVGISMPLFHEIGYQGQLLDKADWLFYCLLTR